MPLAKNRKAAQEREYFKRRLKGWNANFNPDGGSDTDYIPDSGNDDSDCAADDDSLSPAMMLPIELSESEDEESDGSDLLKMEESVVDLDDWDPAFQPLSGVCPLFTRPVCRESFVLERI